MDKNRRIRCMIIHPSRPPVPPSSIISKGTTITKMVIAGNTLQQTNDYNRSVGSYLPTGCIRSKAMMISNYDLSYDGATTTSYRLMCFIFSSYTRQGSAHMPLTMALVYKPQ